MKKLNKGGVITSIVSAFVLLSQIFGLSFDSEIVNKIITAITGVLVIFGIISNNNLGSGSNVEKILETLKELLTKKDKSTGNEKIADGNEEKKERIEGEDGKEEKESSENGEGNNDDYENLPE